MNYTEIIQKFLNGIVEGGSYRSFEKATRGIGERSRIVTLERKINKEQGTAEIILYTNENPTEVPPDQEENHNNVFIRPRMAVCIPPQQEHEITSNFMIMPNKIHAGALGITSFNVQYLSGMAMVAQAYLDKPCYLYFQGNKLDQGNVDEILRIVNIWGTNLGSLELSGDEMAAPSAEGIVNKDALILRGWEVFTN